MAILDGLIVLGFNNTSPCGLFCVVSQRKGEEIVEEMKDLPEKGRRDSRGDEREGQGIKRDREERGTGMKVKKQKK